MVQEILTEAGLSPNEAKIYIALLEHGESPITRIAEYTKLHRSNVYDSIKKLIEKGLTASIQKQKTVFYEAINPNALLRMAEEKVLKIKTVLPSLLLSQQISTQKGEAHLFEGVNAFTNLLYGFLPHNEPILAYGIPKVTPELMKNKIPHFHKERIKQQIPMKHIYNFDAQERINYLKTLPYTEAKHLPENFDSQVSTNICGNQVVLTVWISPIISIQIINPLVAQAYKQYFALLWKAAT